MKLTRAQRRAALAPFRETWQDTAGDEWAATIGHWFGVAEVLYHAGESLPGRWQFRHGGAAYHDPIGNWHPYDQPCPLRKCDAYCTPQQHSCCQCQEEREYVPFLDAGQAGIAMLVYAGNALACYASWLRHAGRDY